MSRAPGDSARRLAEAVAEIAAELQAGRAVPDRADELRRLVAEVGTRPEDVGLRELLQALGPAMRARGVDTLPLEQLPPGVAAFLEAAEEAFGDDESPIDFHEVSRKLERAAIPLLGTTPRQVREQALRDQIRREVAASIAESLRAAGMTPACDMAPDEGDELDDDLDEDRG